MTKYLLAAEADKIQDLIFRSSRLREVVGGSQLLTRFCDEVPGLLDVKDDDIVVNDGGSFRILFDTKEAAWNFGERLAEVYRLATGGSLTVAEPVPVNGDFTKASEEAHENLRRSKRWRKSWQEQEHLPYQEQEHLPYMAFCASCGVGLAKTHDVYYRGEKPQYLCVSCLNKGRERPFGKLGIFLKEFFEEVIGSDEGLSTYKWPGKTKRDDIREKDPLEDIADYDLRRYVAYIVADGNNMGQVFGACESPDQMRTLSEGLSNAMRKALAEPTRMIMEHNPSSGHSNFIPVLPLILGGDDILTLLPAPWALDFARRFAQAYEQEMQKVTRGLDVPDPTLSVAVVICKSKHPYALAHEAGERLLKQAKQMSKRWALKNGGQPRSTVNFEVVLGGRLVEPEVSTDRMLRATLRPYWADDQQGNEWGLSIQNLVVQRYELRNVPRKRLAELRDLYDSANLPSSLHKDEIGDWRERLAWILRRIEQRDEKSSRDVKAALAALGMETEGNHYWRRVSRPPESSWYGHGLPDLLRAWDFALSLSEPRSKYEEE